MEVGWQGSEAWGKPKCCQGKKEEKETQKDKAFFGFHGKDPPLARLGERRKGLPLK
jgi:hypothetical protein